MLPTSLFIFLEHYCFFYYLLSLKSSASDYLTHLITDLFTWRYQVSTICCSGSYQHRDDIDNSFLFFGKVYDLTEYWRFASNHMFITISVDDSVISSNNVMTRYTRDRLNWSQGNFSAIFQYQYYRMWGLIY